MFGLQSDKDTMAWPLVVDLDSFFLSHCVINLSLVSDWGDAVYLSLSAQVDHHPVAGMTQLMWHCYHPLQTMMTSPPSSATDPPLPLSSDELSSVTNRLNLLHDSRHRWSDRMDELAAFPIYLKFNETRLHDLIIASQLLSPVVAWSLLKWTPDLEGYWCRTLNLFRT